jgi:hypothetical protein
MPLPEDVVDACAQFRQGDLVESIPTLHLADLARPLTPAAEQQAELARGEGDELGVEPVEVPYEYGVIVSQTCDVRSNVRPIIKVAPVLEMPDPEAVQSARRRSRRATEIDDIKRGMHVHKILLDGPEGYWYADLEQITTIEKSLLLGKTPTVGFSTQDGYRDFAFRCGHVHDRPAVPDEVEKPVLNSLRTFFRELARAGDEEFSLLNRGLDEEALWLDDWDSPTQAQLWFLGDEEPPAEVKELLDGWRQGLPGMDGVALLPHRYAAFDDVRASEYRDLRVISYWYLSVDEEAD